MADNNNKKSVQDLLNENTGSTDISGDGEINAEEDGPVENKFNEYTKYWDPLKEEFVMSTDTPVVRIYISREIVPEDTGEESDDEMSVGDAIEQSYDMSVVYKDSTITDKNSTVVTTEQGTYIAMNAIDKLS